MMRLQRLPFLLILWVPFAFVSAAGPDGEWAPATRHWSDIRSIRWSPDGTKLLTRSDEQIILWDARSGRKLRSFAMAGSADLTPAWSGDGSRVVTHTTNFHRTVVWDVASGKRIRTLYGHEFHVSCACLTRDGSLGVLGGSDGKVRLWSPKTGEIVRDLASPGRGIMAIAITNDGTTAITSSEDATAIVWDVSGGKVLTTLKGHKNRVHAVALTQDGRTAVTASQDGTVIVWDARTGKARHTLAQQGGGGIDLLSCSDDGKVILAGHSLQITLWEGDTGKEIRSVRFQGHTVAVTLSPDGARYATARGSVLSLWDARSGERLPIEFGTTGAVLCLAWHPRQPRLFVGNESNHAMLWDLGPGAKHQAMPEHGGPVRVVSWDSEGKLLLTGDTGRAAALWDAGTLRKLHSFPIDHWNADGVSLSLDGSQALVVGQHQHSAALWDCKKGEKLRTLPGQRFLHSAHWSPDGARVLLAGQDPTLRILNAATGKEEKGMGVYLASVVDARWNHDGSQIAACYSSFDTSIAHIWDAQSGKRLRTFEGHNDRIDRICWNPDSTQIATGSQDRTIILWDARTGKQRHSLRGHEGKITCISWSPDGKWLASGSVDGSARLWDTRTGKEVCRLLSFASGKEWLILGPDGAHDGSEGGSKQQILRRPGTLEFLDADSYLKKRTPGLLAQLLAP